MFTNLDIVWGPNLQVVQDSCPDKSAKVLGCPMAFQLVTTAIPANCKVFLAWFTLFSVGTYSFDPSHMLLLHGGETENYAVT